MVLRHNGAKKLPSNAPPNTIANIIELTAMELKVTPCRASSLRESSEKPPRLGYCISDGPKFRNGRRERSTPRRPKTQFLPPFEKFALN